MTHCIFQKTLLIIFERVWIIFGARRRNLVTVSRLQAACLPRSAVSHIGAEQVNIKLVGFLSKDFGGMSEIPFPSRSAPSKAKSKGEGYRRSRVVCGSGEGESPLSTG